jgi:DNA-binding HxlR family transcriptional regulator
MPTPSSPSVARVVQEVVKCKWSLQLLAGVRAGTARPMQLKRGLPGLSFKVMNERLTKLVRLGVMTRTVHAEVPPRVEYHLTTAGGRIAEILDAIDRLQRELDGAARSARATGRQRAG